MRSLPFLPFRLDTEQGVPETHRGGVAKGLASSGPAVGLAGVPCAPGQRRRLRCTGLPEPRCFTTAKEKLTVQVQSRVFGLQAASGLVVSLTKFVFHQVAVLSIILTTVVYLTSRKFSSFLWLICNL